MNNRAGNFRSSLNMSNFNSVWDTFHKNKNSSSLKRSASIVKNDIILELSNENEVKSVRGLELAHQMKNILFCSVSHELRNPINHINGILECISSYVSPGDRIQQFVEIALSSTSMLMHKIDDIMDYSLLETNTLNLRMEEFDIRKMMNYIQDMLLHQFDNKLLNFSIYVADSVPEIVYFDQKRVKQVLINLIFNALKYTERGYVTVIIDCDYPRV